MDIEWQNSRSANYIKINDRIGRMQADLVHKLNYNQGDRAIFGFSDDRKTMVVKKSENGLKLSLINRGRNDGRSFASIALIEQFGEEIIGTYELDKYNEDMVVLKKVEAK